MKRERVKVLGLLVFLVGIILSLNSSLSFTGGLIGSEILVHSLSFFLGIAFLILGIIIFSTASFYNPTQALEQRAVSKQMPYAISSSIKEHPSLLRLTEEAVEDPVVEKDMNHLIRELSKGNLSAGIGFKHLQGTHFLYLRGNKARLWFQPKGKGYQIVAKGSKKNEQKVIDTLREIYRK